MSRRRFRRGSKRNNVRRRLKRRGFRRISKYGSSRGGIRL